MPDIDRLVATAQRLITANGRGVTLVQYDRDPATASQPWKGAADPRATPDSTLNIDAVFVQPDSTQLLGLTLEAVDVMKRCEQIAIASPGTSFDPTIYHEVIDGSVTWKIKMTETLKPGDKVALIFLGLRR